MAAELAEHALRLTPPSCPDDAHRRALATARLHSRTASGHAPGRSPPISSPTREKAGCGQKRWLVLSEIEVDDQGVRCSKRRFARLPDAPRSSRSSTAGSPGRAASETDSTAAVDDARRAVARARRLDDDALEVACPFDPRDAGDTRRRTGGARPTRSAHTSSRRGPAIRSSCERQSSCSRTPRRRTRDGSARRASGSSSVRRLAGARRRVVPLACCGRSPGSSCGAVAGSSPPSGRQMRATSASSTAGRGARTTSRRRGSPSTEGCSSRRARRRCTVSSCRMSRSGFDRRSCLPWPAWRAVWSGDPATAAEILGEADGVAASLGWSEASCATVDWPTTPRRCSRSGV